MRDVWNAFRAVEIVLSQAVRCRLVFSDVAGRDIDRIRKSWMMSIPYRAAASANKVENTPHERFPDEFAVRTVLRRLIGPLVAASNDRDITGEILDAIEYDDIDAEAESVIAVSANAIPEAEVVEQPATPEAQPEPGFVEEYDPYGGQE